eukprot:356920-Chlamydomonas_euryale.AAC.1
MDRDFRASSLYRMPQLDGGSVAYCPAVPPPADHSEASSVPPRISTIPSGLVQGGPAVMGNE